MVQAQLAVAREERETAREQLSSMSEQLMDLQTREAMLKAELFELQDSLTNKIATSAAAAAPTALTVEGGAQPDSLDAGKKLVAGMSAGLKGFGGKMGAFGKKKTDGSRAFSTPTSETNAAS